MTSSYLLQLASRAKEVFESSQPEKKNKILRMLLANCQINEKRLQLNLLKPFSAVLDNSNSLNWLTLAYELRTASTDYDEREISKIKEVLHSY